MNSAFIIQARTGSSRLKNKILLNFVDEENILTIIIKKLKAHYPSIPVIIATTKNKEDKAIVEIAKKLQVGFYCGSETNVLERFINAANKYCIEKIVRICSDNPFLLPKFLDSLINSQNDYYDYISYKMNNGLPVIKSHLGLFAEATNIKALRKVREITTDPISLEHVTYFLYMNPMIFNIKLLPLPKYLSNRYDLRFTIDTFKDFEILKKVYSIYISEEFHNAKTLIRLIDNDKDTLQKIKDNINQNTK